MTMIFKSISFKKKEKKRRQTDNMELFKTFLKKNKLSGK